MDLKIFSLTVALLVSISVSAHAQLLNFDFSFTDTSTPQFGNIQGTVTGELIGLTNNASSDPLEVIITSAPAGLGLTTPYDFGTFRNIYGTLTVSSGEIISTDDFMVSSENGPFLDLEGEVGGGGPNAVYNSANNNFVQNGGEATYTLVTTPEPSEYSLMLLGALVLWGAGRFLREHTRLQRAQGQHLL